MAGTFEFQTAARRRRGPGPMTRDDRAVMSEISDE